MKYGAEPQPIYDSAQELQSILGHYKTRVEQLSISLRSKTLQLEILESVVARQEESLETQRQVIIDLRNQLNNERLKRD